MTSKELAEHKKRALSHFLDLAHKGRLLAVASTGEKRARRLAVAIINDTPGLDDLALDGLIEFATRAKLSPTLAARSIEYVQ
jgi:hypothetical protein